MLMIMLIFVGLTFPIPIAFFSCLIYAIYNGITSYIYLHKIQRGKINIRENEIREVFVPLYLSIAMVVVNIIRWIVTYLIFYKIFGIIYM